LSVGSSSPEGAWRRESPRAQRPQRHARERPLDPLLNGSDLEDVSHHPAYIQDGRTGTFKTSKDKFDYLLL
jgi:hypothetical protein